MSASNHPECPEFSFVVPVFNSQENVRNVVARIRSTFVDNSIQIVLVDDGSHDLSSQTCRTLCEAGRGDVEFIELARNFGEHSAVLAGLSRATAARIAVLDDDGQNPPEELPRMFAEMNRTGVDVLYGKYVERKHSWFRQFGSQVNDRVANLMLGKPKGLYLSSFKVMNRFIVDEITKYRGPFPYIDGLICRSTNRLGQTEVLHQQRLSGSSNYTLKRLLKLWLNMFLGFSIWPLRFASILGFVMAALSCLWLSIILIDKIWFAPNLTAGIPTVLAVIVLFSGVQLVVLGTIGEYVGRIFLANNGQPQFVIRSISCGVPSS